MAIPTRLPPAIQTYHCHCSTLVLATTHTLSTLPRRAPPSLDSALILPLPSSLPAYARLSTLDSPAPESSEQNADEAEGEEKDEALPQEGYTTLLSLAPDAKAVVVRREDGFERRIVWRCGRCRVVVAYEIVSGDAEAHAKDGKEKERGRVLYILPGGLMSTEFMNTSKRKITDAEVGIGKGVGGKNGIWE